MRLSRTLTASVDVGVLFCFSLQVAPKLTSDSSKRKVHLYFFRNTKNISALSLLFASPSQPAVFKMFSFQTLPKVLQSFGRGLKTSIYLSFFEDEICFVFSADFEWVINQAGFGFHLTPI